MGPAGSHREHVEKNGAPSGGAQGYDIVGQRPQETGRGAYDCAGSRTGLRESRQGLGRGAGAETCAGAEEIRNCWSDGGSPERRRGCRDQRDNRRRRGSESEDLAAAWGLSDPWRAVGGEK